LLDIAKDIIDGKIKHAFVAMDRDFDNIKGMQLRSQNILYTFGYSWENDVWSPEVVEKVVESCTLLAHGVNTIALEVKEHFDRFYREMKTLVKIELNGALEEKTLIPREGTGRLIISGKPKINREEVLRLLILARRDKFKCSSISFSVQSDCFGHLLGLFAREVVEDLHLRRSLKRTGMRVEPLNCLAINQFQILLKSGLPTNLKEHFDIQFGRITIKEFAKIKKTKK